HGVRALGAEDAAHREADAASRSYEPRRVPEDRLSELPEARRILPVEAHQDLGPVTERPRPGARRVDEHAIESGRQIPRPDSEVHRRRAGRAEPEPIHFAVRDLELFGVEIRRPELRVGADLLAEQRRLLPASGAGVEDAFPRPRTER